MVRGASSLWPWPAAERMVGRTAMASISAVAPAADVHLHRAPGRLVLVAVALAGCLVAAGSLALALSAESSSGVQIVLLEWISVPYVAAGLIAWWRRPGSRLGPLMIAGGFATVVSALQFAEADLAFTLGVAFDLLPAALFLHVYLAFPSGRLTSTFERFLVCLAYASAIGLQLVKLSLDGAGRHTVVQLTSAPELALKLEKVQLLSISVACLLAFGVLATRRRHRGRPLRSSLALLIDSFALGLVMIAILFAVAAFEGPAFREIQRATLLVLGASPI